MTILQFPTKPKETDLAVACGGAWTCGCGSQEWILYGNGVCLCTGCHCISTVIKVVEDKPDGPQPAQPPIDNAFVAPGCEQFGEP